jgi:hypothetical protein
VLDRIVSEVPVDRSEGGSAELPGFPGMALGSSVDSSGRSELLPAFPSFLLYLNFNFVPQLNVFLQDINKLFGPEHNFKPVAYRISKLSSVPSFLPSFLPFSLPPSSLLTLLPSLPLSFLPSYPPLFFCSSSSSFVFIFVFLFLFLFFFSWTRI